MYEDKDNRREKSKRNRLKRLLLLKNCDECGTQVDMKQIHIYWENHSFSWICDKCFKKKGKI